MTLPGDYDFRLEYTFSDNRLAELDRQLSLLLTTREGTMPLDREFGINSDWLDKPIETAKLMYTAEVVKKIPKFIPSVRVREVTWQADTEGRLIPRLVITDD